MDRFLSNTINRVDKKGRVSIPANFRTVLAGQSSIHIILSVDHPVAEAGGADFMEANLRRLSAMDPFSEEYEMWSFCLLGDADEIKVDTEGRIILTDHLRAHTGIEDEVAFVGRGHFFQLWEPKRFNLYREAAREKVRLMRRSLSSLGDSTSQSNSPTSQAQPASSRAGASANLQMGNKEQDT